MALRDLVPSSTTLTVTYKNFPMDIEVIPFSQGWTFRFTGPTADAITIPTMPTFSSRLEAYASAASSLVDAIDQVTFGAQQLFDTIEAGQPVNLSAHAGAGEFVHEVLRRIINEPEALAALDPTIQQRIRDAVAQQP